MSSAILGQNDLFFEIEIDGSEGRRIIRPMSLNDHEKIGEIAQQFAMLADLNEPEALIAVLARACRRKANGAISPDLAKRWTIVANALIEAEATINAANSPDARKLEAHMAEWSGQAPKRDATIGELTSGDDPGVFKAQQAPKEPPAAA